MENNTLDLNVDNRYLTLVANIDSYNENTAMTILTTKKSSGNLWTIAHQMVKEGFKFPDDHPVLYVVGNSNWSVAHEQCNQGHIFPTYSDLLNLSTLKKLSVKRLNDKNIEDKKVVDGESQENKNEITLPTLADIY